MVSQYPVLAGAAGLGLCLFYFLGPSFKKNGIYGAASSFTSAWAFYGRRHDFLHEKFRSLDGQNVFTFNVLQHLVIVAKGAEARKIFFDDKYMSLKDGYKILHGAAPLVEDLDVYRGERINGDSIRQMLFNVILRKDRLLEIIPGMLDMIHLQTLTWGKEGQFDPFVDVCDLLFQMTVYMSSCRELATDLDTIKSIAADYWKFEKSATPVALLLPWIPSQAKKDRTASMTRLYQTMCRYVDVRQAAETPTSDAIDLLLKEGVEKDDIVSFVLTVIFAGNANTGIVSSWILLYLGFDQEWKSKITTEIQALITNYAGDYSTDSVYKQLTTIPLSAWEDEMPMTDAVLRETLRLTVNGVPLRRNLDKDIHILGGTTNIPRGSFLVYPIWDTHLNPEIYDNPREFDPARFGPGREEDKRATLSFLGWGAGRHPCPGMKVAKLEVKMIVAFLIHAFEFNVVDATGNPVYSIPQPDYNDIYHTRPLDPCFVKYRRIRQ